MQNEDIMKFCSIGYFWTLMYRDFLSSKTRQKKKNNEIYKANCPCIPKKI